MSPYSLDRPAAGRVAGLALILFVLLTSAGPAHSQEGESDPSDSDQLTIEEQIYVRSTAKDVVTVSSVATKLPAEVGDLPVSVSVLPAGLIEEQSARDLGDLLPNAAGVTVQPNNGAFSLFVIRGLDSLNSGLVLIDGAPEPEATVYPTYNIEQVEVLRGPAASLYGGSPLAGAVGIVRKKPTGDSVGLVRATAGSFDTYDLSFDYGTRLGDGADFRINALGRTTDGYRDGRDGETMAVNPAVSFDLGDGGLLRLSGESVANDYAPDSGLPILDGEVVDVPRTTSYQSPVDDSEQDVTRLQGHLELGFGDWRLRNRLYYRELDWQSSGTILTGTFPFPPTFAPVTLRNLLTLDNHQEYLGNQLEGIWITDRNDLLVGAEVVGQSDDYTIDVGTLPPIDPFQPVETLQGEVPVDPGLRQQGRTETDVLAAYAVERFQLGDRAVVYLGGRFDSIDFDDAVTGFSRSDDEFSPLAGLSASVGGGVNVYGSYSSGFAPASSRVIGDRLPEESEQVELGLKGTLLEGRVLFGLAGYRLDRENIAIFDSNGVTAQQGSQRSEGFELEATFRPARDWRLELDYATTDAELTSFTELVRIGPGPTDFIIVDRSGNVPAFAPESSASLWIHRQLGRWSLGAGTSYRDEFAIAADNQFFADSVTLVDVAVSYSWPSLRLFVNGRNLTDEEYVGQGFGNTSVIPGDPASVLVGVEWRP